MSGGGSPCLSVLLNELGGCHLIILAGGECLNQMALPGHPTHSLPVTVWRPGRFERLSGLGDYWADSRTGGEISLPS